VIPTLAYAGHVAFSFCAELKRPSGFPNANHFLQLLPPHQCRDILLCRPAHCVICARLRFPNHRKNRLRPRAADDHNRVVNGSVMCKYLHVRMWKGINVIHQNNLKSVGSRVGICGGLWVVSWIIAEAILSFNLWVSRFSYKRRWERTNCYLNEEHTLLLLVQVRHTRRSLDLHEQGQMVFHTSENLPFLPQLQRVVPWNCHGKSPLH